MICNSVYNVNIQSIPIKVCSGYLVNGKSKKIVKELKINNEAIVCRHFKVEQAQDYYSIK